VPSDPELLAALLTLRGKYAVPRAVRLALENHPTALAIIIESHRPLNRREAKCIADYIRGKFKHGQGRVASSQEGLTRADELKRAVIETAAQVRESKAYLKEKGLSYYGRADEAIDIVLAYRAKFGRMVVPSKDSVKDELNRSRRSNSRKN
jgi:hypothetical protein